jgi:hypothetical protein
MELKSPWVRHMVALYTASILILIRSVTRVVEYHARRTYPYVCLIADMLSV